MRITYQTPTDQPQEILEPGWYDFTVAHVYVTDRDGNPLKSKTGTPFIKVVCHEDESGVAIYHLLFLEPENAKKISAFLWACQVAVREGQDIEINAATFSGSSFRGKVDANPGFDGVHRNRITRVIQREDAQEAQEDAQDGQGPFEQGDDDVPF